MSKTSQLRPSPLTMIPTAVEEADRPSATACDLTLRLTVAVGMFLAVFFAAVSQAGATSSSLRHAVQSSVNHEAHRPAHATVVVTVQRCLEGWAYGTELVPSRTGDEGANPPAVFIARHRKTGWRVALQDSRLFLQSLKAAPRGLVPAGLRKLYEVSSSPPGIPGGSGPDEPQFSLPWGVGETWQLWYGPHNTHSDYGPHPFTSLDFSNGSSNNGIVRAAAAGTLELPCANLVVVIHSADWATGYYHLPESSIHEFHDYNGKHVNAGDPIGRIGTGTGCQGYASGNHVHFSIYHFLTSRHDPAFPGDGTVDDMDGDIIGGYVIHDGSRDGNGWLTHINGGQIVTFSDFGGSGNIYSDGTNGSGGKTAEGCTGCYYTIAAITVYGGPGTDQGLVGALPPSAAVSIVCQTGGQTVGNSSIWDKISGQGHLGQDRYIPDYYVDTPNDGSFSPGIPQCASGGGGSGSGGSGSGGSGGGGSGSGGSGSGGSGSGGSGSGGSGGGTGNALPIGYWIDVDESGTTTASNLGGSGSLAGTGQGNVTYGYSQECAPSQDGGPFSIGHYPPLNCTQLGRPYNSAGSPEHPSGFWFTGNQNCVNAGRPFSGANFTWHVQLPAAGHWHVDVYIPNWTSYGFGNQYILTSADGQAQNNGFTQQAYHGQWVTLFGSHAFAAGQDYTVELTSVDAADSFCHYQMADQMRWVYDGP